MLTDLETERRTISASELSTTNNPSPLPHIRNSDSEQRANMDKTKAERQNSSPSQGAQPYSTKMETEQKLTKSLQKSLSDMIGPISTAPLPHLTLLTKIQQRDGIVAIKDDPPLLLGFQDLLRSYWEINVEPLATYSLGRTVLVLAIEGIWQLNEEQDRIRYRGRQGEMVNEGWVNAVLDNSDDDEEHD